MDELVSELGTLQSDIAELSTGAMAEATQIMGYVRDVEDAATQATAITTESQQVMMKKLHDVYCDYVELRKYFKMQLKL